MDHKIQLQVQKALEKALACDLFPILFIMLTKSDI